MFIAYSENTTFDTLSIFDDKYGTFMCYPISSGSIISSILGVYANIKEPLLLNVRKYMEYVASRHVTTYKTMLIHITNGFDEFSRTNPTLYQKSDKKCALNYAKRLEFIDRLK